MNPFDLGGPQFLLFYALLGAAVLFAVWMARRSSEAGAPDAPMLQDYLEIAYLRGGPYEALRVATMSLIDRGLIEVSGRRLQTKGLDTPQLASRRLERMLLAKFRGFDEVAPVFDDPGMQEAATAECAPELTRKGLLPDKQTQARRGTILAVAAFVLAAVAAIKILVALSRGRSNIVFLIVETIAFLVITYKLTSGSRTEAGDAQLANLQVMFGGLHDRAASLVPGNGSPDLALLAAVFGAAAVPSTFAFGGLFSRAKRGTTSSGAGCGSSSGCGSSGSSCGSSCGGGGCGGGCGGCGS